MREFRNTSGLDFTDISTERYREYLFHGGDIVKIDDPVKLHVSKSGGHRIFSKDGLCHYIPNTWIHLSWKARDNETDFCK